jgi:hypothetical protein
MQILFFTKLITSVMSYLVKYISLAREDKTPKVLFWSDTELIWALRCVELDYHLCELSYQ